MPSLAGERRPGTAFAKVMRERLKAGDIVVLAGAVRPLRRLVRQAGKIAERPIRLIDAWADVAAAAPGDVLALEAPLGAGFRVPEQGATVIAAADLFGPEAAVSGGARAILPMGEVDLRPGDVAVDRDHGLCVFEGLEPVAAQGGEPSEALRLRFAGDAILMVPVSQADRIWRYGPEPDAVTLDKLDGGTWPRRRLEAEATMARTARLMLEAARARRETEAPVLAPPARDMERFAAGFGFAPTPDQAAAFDAVMADLASGRADGPAGVRRCRIRQDRGGAPGAGGRDLLRPAGGADRPHHRAGAPAYRDPAPPLRTLRHRGGAALAPRGPRRGQARQGGAGRRLDPAGGRHPRARRQRGVVRGSRPDGDRRGAALRRQDEGRPAPSRRDPTGGAATC